MGKAQWTNSYGNTDHIQTISEICISYFNGLGAKLADAKESGSKLEPFTTNKIYARQMLEIASASAISSGAFNCGEESVVLERLTGESSGGYKRYFELVYNTLKEMEK